MLAHRGLTPARSFVAAIVLAAVLFGVWILLPEATLVGLLVVAVVAEALVYGAVYVRERRRDS